MSETILTLFDGALTVPALQGSNSVERTLYIQSYYKPNAVLKITATNNNWWVGLEVYVNGARVWHYNWGTETETVTAEVPITVLPGQDNTFIIGAYKTIEPYPETVGVTALIQLVLQSEYSIPLPPPYTPPQPQPITYAVLFAAGAVAGGLLMYGLYRLAVEIYGSRK